MRIVQFSVPFDAVVLILCKEILGGTRTTVYHSQFVEINPELQGAASALYQPP